MAALIPLIINGLFKLKSNELLAAEWSAGDALLFYGSLLSFLGTVALGALSLHQNHLYRKESEKREAQLEARLRQAELPKFFTSIRGSSGSLSNMQVEVMNISNNNAIKTEIYRYSVTSKGEEQSPLVVDCSDVSVPLLPSGQKHTFALKNGKIRELSSITLFIKCEDEYGDCHFYEATCEFDPRTQSLPTLRTRYVNSKNTA